MKITFNNVSTQTAEKKFLKMILSKSKLGNKEVYQTFFLNGVWGSGKTTFLEKVESASQHTKFIKLKLWEIKDERSVTEIAFSLLHPKFYLLMRIVVLISVVTSVLMSPAINLGLSPLLPSCLITLATICALLVTVHQFLKVKSDTFYSKVIPFCLNNKVLIIDDFDRISVERQNETYKLFNILHGKVPIVFIGDYQKISKNEKEEGKYLQKIIDRRIELPSVLNPRNIWANYLSKLSLEFDLVDDYNKPSILNIIKYEERTLRELKQFSDLLNYELFEQKKKDLVNVEQLITIAYIFLFYPEYYLELKDFGMLLLSEEIEDIRLKEQPYQKLQRSKSTKEKFYEIINDRSEKLFPRLFNDNKGVYYIDEYINNLSEKQAQEIFSDKEMLYKVIKSKDNSEFFAFLRVEYSKYQSNSGKSINEKFTKEREIFETNRDILEKISINEARLGNLNSIVDFVILKLGNRIHFDSLEKAKQIKEYKSSDKEAKKELINKIEFTKWEKYLERFSLSEKIKFHIENRLGGQYIIPTLTALAQKMINEGSLDSEYHKPYLYFLVTRTFNVYRENKNQIKDVVEKFSDSEFLTFWELMGLVDGTKIKTSILDFDRMTRIDISDIYTENKPRFDSIERKTGMPFKIVSIE